MASTGAPFLSLLAIALYALIFFAYTTYATDVSRDGRAIIINGERRILFSGSIHYPRSTPEMWPDLIRKAKLGGLDAIETYVFWNAHEPRQREYNFEGNLDLIRFIKEIQNAGLYSILRIGPYVCAEWNYGGVPAWLRKIPGMQFRTDNQPFELEMQNFTRLIVDMLKQERLFAPQGGPIIISQIENEYGNIQGPYGEAGKRYINWCANLAESLHVGVPWIMCQQPDAPQPMINTCNGFYCDNFKPNNPRSPKMWTENWTGWFKAWDKPDPHRPAEDVAYAVARFFQTGGTFQNYYMYHGGTNFGRTTGGPYITTTYDYDAPLDEYGLLRQPKWGHMKELHAALKMMERALTHGNVYNIDLGNGASATKYSSIETTPGCFLSNTNTTTDMTVKFERNEFYLPAWSVSILPDCKMEVYNTAKINTQTWVMVKKPGPCRDEEPNQLTWSWIPENLTDALNGMGSFTTNKLLEQIQTTADESDYLWYITSVDFKNGSNMTLRVNTTGHILHAFVNGQLIGSEYAPNGGFRFVFEEIVQLKPGRNIIALLSATVGLKNYGAMYELEPAGIVGGPVQLIGSGNNTIDLSSNQWTYKIGLHGMEKELFLEKCSEQPLEWRTDYIPTKRPFTWYKTTFQAPVGDEPVVIDMLGMGKGEAWVNSRSIGRFWPNYTADPDVCHPCDYRGAYSDDRCRTDCGKPAQRWYHVPRSFIKPGVLNTLVLFEEAGGDPLYVNFHTVTVGTACGQVAEGDTLTLSCNGGRTISDIEFASFGDTKGTCGSFKKGSCEANGALAVIKKACIGKVSCSIEANEKLLGSASCGTGVAKRLAVQAVC